MLRLVFGKQNIAIKFYHKKLEAKEILDMHGARVDGPRRCTMARISFDGEKADDTYGLSVCNPVDNFNRSIGREKSLADCLRRFDKRLRSKVWQEYEVQFGF
jgi:hypothetical protein